MLKPSFALMMGSTSDGDTIANTEYIPKGMHSNAQGSESCAGSSFIYMQ